MDGTAIATINDGQDGSNGTNGTNGTDGNDGTDGITPTVTVTSISNGHNVAFSYGTGDSRNVDFDVMNGDVANQLQADWNQTNSSYADYIKNKPTIPQTGKLLEAKESVYVDLGLTSGTLWATMNVGAATKSDVGNYYMWGKGDKVYNSLDSINNDSSLSSSADTAKQVFGSNWSTPTKSQWQELIDECTWVWNTVNGVYGCTVSKNNKSIFLPAVGRYYQGVL